MFVGLVVLFSSDQGCIFQSINLTSGNQSAGGLQSLDVLEQYSNF